MPRAARWAILLALGALAALAAVAATKSTHPGQRRVPFGFFGTVLDPAVSDPAHVSAATLDAQMARMARSGVESLRVTFAWSQVEPARGVYDWSTADRLVEDAARHGISLLANLVYTPAWASEQPRSPRNYRFAPTSPQLFADFTRQLVRRYGPAGVYWSLHPGLSRVPVRQWQIWNEQGFNLYWATLPWPATYTRLLRAAYMAIHSVDPGADVVAGSLVAVPGDSQWAQAEELYRAGAKRYFDSISVHPFTIDPASVSATVKRVSTIVGYVRDVMRRNGDGGKPVILTELSWPGAVGSVPPPRLLGLETTPKGEILRLSAAYRWLASHLRQTGVTQAYWYTWASTFDPSDPRSDVGYRFAGLTRFAGGAFAPQPALASYSVVAARYEGCDKGSDARRCR